MPGRAFAEVPCAHLSPFTPQLCLGSPVTLGLCSSCVSGWGAPTQLLCVCREWQSSRVGIRSPGVRGKGHVLPVFPSRCGCSEPLGWSLLLSQGSESPWREAVGSRGIAGHSCSLWSVLSLVQQQQQQCAGCVSAQRGQDRCVLVLCESVRAEVSAGDHGSVLYPCPELLPGADCSTPMETSGGSWS